MPALIRAGFGPSATELSELFLNGHRQPEVAAA
jgi:hypothetical protein